MTNNGQVTNSPNNDITSLFAGDAPKQPPAGGARRRRRWGKCPSTRSWGPGSRERPAARHAVAAAPALRTQPVGSTAASAPLAAPTSTRLEGVADEFSFWGYLQSRTAGPQAFFFVSAKLTSLSLQLEWNTWKMELCILEDIASSDLFNVSTFLGLPPLLFFGNILFWIFFSLEIWSFYSSFV